MTIKLSICIPTYNFGNYIGEALESIIPQLQKNMEIVVLDGGSTDQTSQVVSRFQQTCPQLHYVQQNYRGGIDKDLHSCVQNAKGEYCWLFSADDVMEKDAIETVLEALNEPSDIYICDFEIYDLKIQKFLKKENILNNKETLFFNLSNLLERKLYFHRSITTSSFFSFLSSIIINRHRWISTPIQNQFIGTHWGLASHIFTFIQDGLTVRYIPKFLLKKRSFNDSFMEHGYIQRLSITIDQFDRIGSYFFGESSIEACLIRKAIQYETPASTFIDAKQSIKTSEDKKNLIRLVNKIYYDSPVKSLVITIGVYLIPKKTVPFLKSLNRIKKNLLKNIQILNIKKRAS